MVLSEAWKTSLLFINVAAKQGLLKASARCIDAANLSVCVQTDVCVCSRPGGPA